ncbi:hypothetical protein DPMN_054996 [Dreissena polymorpha]|uniref:Uncharacterized protein n=1 Tax=Dreissena polymorpha TaxID=45954 RepID=A0A9D4CP56_DREPO|nr:hypothetical protein DPMN_054996 [Dreissena polymorpha]
MIKHAGQQKLSNSDYWVKDQYPKEMEDKRRPLYKIADELRKHKYNKVVQVRDRLFANGKPYIPQQTNSVNKGNLTTMTNASNQNKGSGNQTSTNTQRTNTHALEENHWSRTFYRRQSHQQRIDNSGITTQNKFSALSTPASGETSTRFFKHAGKKKENIAPR